MRQLLKRYGTEVALLIALLWATHAYQTRKHPTGPAPQLAARLLDGSSLQIGGAQSGPLVLHFWATWCGVCRAEQGNLQRLASDAKVVGVASRSGSDQDIQRYMTEHGLSFPVINDARGALARRFGVTAYPTSFFLGTDGEILTSEVGYTTTLGLELRWRFALLMSGRW